MIGHLPVVPLILMIDAMSVVKRDIMLMTVIAIADEEEAGHDLDHIPDPREGDTLTHAAGIAVQQPWNRTRGRTFQNWH